MADERQLRLIQSSLQAWNRWRKKDPETRVDLSRAILQAFNLKGANLFDADLSEADLLEADLSGGSFYRANLARAHLVKANLALADLRNANLFCATLPLANLSNADARGAYLVNADLRGANLREADLSEVNLSQADLSHADLTDAKLTGASLVRTNLANAKLHNCHIYGISAWDLNLQDAQQLNLIITPDREPAITVDNLKIAQFIYILLNNPEVREVIDTITSKVVLILGRFTSERKALLDVLREQLRNHNYTPILFDFEGPTSRDITETISILAHMARFVIADITDARSVPQELMAIVPHLPSVPIQPLVQSSRVEYGMFEHFPRYPWVLPIYRYSNIDDVVASLSDKVIVPAEAKAKEQRKTSSK